MPAFSGTSNKRLDSCHEDLQLIFRTVVSEVDCSILCGHREEAEQELAFSEGRSKVQFPGSKHNQLPSMAADVGPYPINWVFIKRWYWFGGYVKAVADRLFDQGLISHRLRWGGDWDRDNDLDDQRFNDLPHFELVKP
ncbi:MAG: hypothetical protein ACPGF7_13645 [Pontibacterium sp.]